MNKLFIPVLLFLTVAFTGVEPSGKSLQVLVKNNSEVSISGTSNVNSFICCYDIAKLETPIPVDFMYNGKNMIFKSTVLELENNSFDCGHKAINKDFKKLLKTETYPKIKLQLLGIQELEAHKEVYKAHVKIYIADCAKTYYFPVTVTKNEMYQVTGELNLNLQDFNLEAPKKMLGLIVVHDEITVNFNLYLKLV